MIRGAVMVVWIPALLLLSAWALEWQLRGPWESYQPPIEQPWLENVQPPPPVEVGHSWLFERLYEPAKMAGRARLARRAALISLVFSLVMVLVLWRFQAIPTSVPLFIDGFVCASARLLPRLAIWLAPVYVAEFLSAVYLQEVLCLGAMLYVTPAISIVVLGAALPFAIGVLGDDEVELPPVRFNAIRVSAEEQPELFEYCPDGLNVALNAEPILLLVHGRSQCQDDVVDGNMLMVPLTLCGMLTVAEFRCLVEEACLPLKWPAPLWEVEHVADAAQEMERKLSGILADSPLVRAFVAIFPVLGVCAIVSDGRPMASARAIAPSFEADRVVAARLGSRDWARAMLKSFVAFYQWPRFLYERFGPHGTPSSGAGLAIGFQAYFNAQKIEEALQEIVADAHPGGPGARLAALGYRGREAWPELDLHPAEPALALIRGYERLDRELTVAERARFTLLPDLTTNTQTP